jgi:hypothetical protein
LESPVLLVVFNRPDTTIQVFEAIRKFKVPKLYISADAPREGNLEDEIKCAEVRQIVQNVDWDCDVHYRFLEKNVGCGYGPSSAISWVLEKEDRVIILEDDCVPAQPFFTYCDYLLEKYKDDERVWLISGRSHHPQYHLFKKYDYIFSRFGHTWGWATWKRCWNNFDIDMSDLPLFLEENGFNNIFSNSKHSRYYSKKYFNLMQQKDLNTHAWDFQFGYIILKNSGLSIVPSNNLIHNIGSFGTHSSGESYAHKIPKNEEYQISSEPKFIMINKDYEDMHFKLHINPHQSIIKKIIRKVKKIKRYIQRRFVVININILNII